MMLIDLPLAAAGIGQTGSITAKAPGTVAARADHSSISSFRAGAGRSARHHAGRPAHRRGRSGQCSPRASVRSRSAGRADHQHARHRQHGACAAASRGGRGVSLSVRIAAAGGRASHPARAARVPAARDHRSDDGGPRGLRARRGRQCRSHQCPADAAGTQMGPGAAYHLWRRPAGVHRRDRAQRLRGESHAGARHLCPSRSWPAAAMSTR